MSKYWQAVRKFAQWDLVFEVALVLALAIAGAVAYFVDR